MRSAVIKLSSTERGALFRHSLRLQDDHHCACAQKWCHFSYFPRAFKQKIKALRPKITKKASKGSCLNFFVLQIHPCSTHIRHRIGWKSSVDFSTSHHCICLALVTTRSTRCRYCWEAVWSRSRLCICMWSDWGRLCRARPLRRWQWSEEQGNGQGTASWQSTTRDKKWKRVSICG